MRILFAVSNDNITTSVVNKYQQKYKEIITSKNVYYFNAIIKELQRNKNYDAIVIGEDLEPISNNNYDAIDKFLFEKLDSISDEASKPTGEDIPVILICSDRRTKADQLLIKLFSIGVYNAIIGNDRSIDTVCNLINKPRNKKEAKLYYKVESDEITPYEHGNDLDVSETEIQNILSHYRKIGLNVKKCVESFDSIADQYNETQLRIIIKFLPKEVKEILEVNSPRYQKLVSKGTVLTNGKYSPYQTSQDPRKPGNLDILTKDLGKAHLSKPVVIPSTIDIKKGNVTTKSNMNNSMNSNFNINNGMNNNINNMNYNPSMNNYANNMNYNPNMNNYGNNMNYNPNMNNYANNMNYNPNMNNYGNNMNYNPNMNNNTNNMNYNQGMNNNINNTNYNQGMNNNVNNTNYNQGMNNNVNNTNYDQGINNNANNMNNDIDNRAKEVHQKAMEILETKRKRGRPRKNPEAVTPVPVTQSTDIPKTMNNSSNIQMATVEPKSIATVPEAPISVIPTPVAPIPVDSTNNTVVEPKRKRGRPPKKQQEQVIENINEEVQDIPPVQITPIEDTFAPIENNLSQNNVIDNDLESLFTLDSIDTINNEDIKNTTEAKEEKNTTILESSNLQPTEQKQEKEELNDIYSSIYGSNYNIDNAINQDINKEAENTAYSVEIKPADNKSDTTVMFNGFEDFDNSSVNLTSTNREPKKAESSISDNFVAGNGKLVAFVGTSKNGTSFIVNNLAQLLSQSGVRTAIIDFTQNKNSYYMFTNNDQNLMKKATNSMKALSKGKIDGVNINKNLTVFTSLPDEIEELDGNVMMQTLSNNFDITLMDCDFKSEINCFKNANEIYLVQSMDTFTIQPLTQFLSDLKLKNVLDESKLRIIVNKYVRLKILNEKMIIGGMSKYNEPSMTLQRDLFNSQTIRYTVVPFETDTYAKYLENIAMCKLSLNGYSQNLINSLEKLRSMVYPLVSGGNKSKKTNYREQDKKSNFSNNERRQPNEPKQQFSNDINNTLNKMRTNNF